MPGPSPFNPGPDSTLLVITPVSGFLTPVLTPYSARGISQVLKVLNNQLWLRRDCNGNLVDVTDARFRKYTSTVTCRDGETPCLDGAWIGTIVEVSCACELSYPTGATPQRSEVSGSSRTEGSITFYRPRLTMMVSDIDVPSFAEYQGIYNWKISLAEV